MTTERTCNYCLFGRELRPMRVLIYLLICLCVSTGLLTVFHEIAAIAGAH